MLSGFRNVHGLSEREVEQCLHAWQLLTDSEQFYVPLDVTQAHQHGSRTTFREADNIDVQPGDGVDANSRMSLLACLAHELAHARRYRGGLQSPHGDTPLLA